MTDDVPLEEKKRRINDLLAVQKQIAGRKTARWVGREIEVLVEGADELGRPYGRSRQGKRVIVKRSLAPPGQVVRVLVEEAFPGQLAGPLAA
jgi:tRNA-2-methylthio-N6-dimethylallyladenosine synthase